jgi:hypothetical protein
MDHDRCILLPILQLAIYIWSAKIEAVADIVLVNASGRGLGALAEVTVQRDRQGRGGAGRMSLLG